MKKANYSLLIIFLALICLASCDDADTEAIIPYELPKSLVVWLDGKDVNGDKSTVSNPTEWKDKSGKGNDFTLINSPAYNTDGFYFDKTQREAAINTELDTTISGELTYYIVVDSIGLTGSWQYLTGFTLNGSSPWRSQNSMGIAKFTSAEEIVLLYNSNTGNPVRYPSYTGGKGILGINVSSSELNTHANGITKDSTINNSISINEVSLATHAAENLTEYLTCKVHEVVLFSTLLSETERQKVEGYLAHKWGTTGQLPSNHPYKSNAPTGL